MKIAKSVIQCYNKLSNFGKILVFLVILLTLIVFFKSIIPVKESMIDREKFLFKTGDAIYDDFYANIYDYLVFNVVKNDYEIGIIKNSTQPGETSIIADIGCGTGHHVRNLSSQNLNVIGIDISPSMIAKAKEEFPQGDFRVGNALDNGLFKFNSLTHILCFFNIIRMPF